MEVIAEHRHLVVDGGKTVSLAHKVGNERHVVYSFGHVSLVAGEHQHVIEVEIACFQHTHYLHSARRFAVEGNGGRGNELTEKAAEDDEIGCQFAPFHQFQQLVKQRVHAESRFLKELVVALCPIHCDGSDRLRQPFHQCIYRFVHVFQACAFHLNIVLLLCLQLGKQIAGIYSEIFSVGVAQHVRQLLQTVSTFLCRIALGLECYELPDHGGDGCLRQRITRCYVERIYLGRNAMYNGLQQHFVAHDHRRALSCLVALVLQQPFGHVAGLQVLGRGRHVAYFLVGFKACIKRVVGTKFVWKLVQAPVNIGACLVGLHHIVVVVVPVKACLSLAFQSREQFLFHLLQHVEAHKDVGVVAVGQLFLFHDVSVQHTLVSQMLCPKACLEFGIDIVQLAPKVQEAFLEYARIAREVGKKPAEFCLLVLRKIVYRVQFVQVSYVAEHLFGVCHVLVDVVEVCQQQLPPAVKLVERLVSACLFHIYPVQNAQAFNRIGDGLVGLLAE